MDENTQSIYDLLTTKAALKQDVCKNALDTFKDFKNEVQKIITELKGNIKDKRIRLKFDEQNNHEFHVYIGSDVLVFQVHTNVFKLPDENPMWQNDYLEEDGNRGFFGIIHIYNFLAESFLQNRVNDAGYLIGRLFLNNEDHFMVEGKGQLGFLFRDLSKNTLDNKIIRHIIQVSFAHALNFDLFIPPYEAIHQVSVAQMKAIGESLKPSTGKRVGFKFQAEDGETLG